MYKIIVYCALLFGLSTHHRNAFLMETSTFSPSMAAISSNCARRVQAVRAEFAKQKALGIRSQIIITVLAERFFLSENTVEAIVWHKGRYASDKSTSAQSAARA